MKNLYIKPGYNFPEIKIDSELGTINISGRAHPENIDILLDPLTEWLEEYKLSPATKTTVDIKLDYFNTTASKVLIFFLSKLSSVDNTKMSIIWYYYDDDTLETLKDFKSLLKVDFEFAKAEEFI